MQRKHTFLITVICIFLIAALSVPTLAWLASINNTVDSGIEGGSVIQQYFHCGSGTEGDPFVITRPIHYYHLAELYLRNPSNFADNNYYFQLGYKGLDSSRPNDYLVYSYDDYGNTDGSFSDTLNMAYYAGDLSLVPIGTSQHPFNGVFDGKGLTIENLSICAAEEVNGTLTGSSDIGIFGCVLNTDESAQIKDTYFENVTISLDGANCAFGGIDDTSSVHTEGNVCVGTIIGHLYHYTNAQGRNYGDQTAATAASPISQVYVNNITISGGAASGVTCDYGLIGHVETVDETSAQTIKKYVQTSEMYGEGDESWGGSIDMYSLYNRVTTAITTASTYRYYPATETVTAAASSSSYPATTVTSKSTSNWRRSISFWSAASLANSTTASVNMTGGAIYGSNSGDWNYLYGLTSTQTTTTTTYTKTGAVVTAYVISDNNYFFSFDGNGTTPSGNKTYKNASKLIPVDLETGKTEADGYCYYVLVNNTNWYLDVSGTTVSMTTVKSSSTARWFRADGSGEFYTVIGGVNYYLYYNGAWSLSQNASRTALYSVNGSGTIEHYLTATSDGVEETAVAADAYVWEKVGSGGGFTLAFDSANATYYLGFKNGELGVSGTATVWYEEADAATGKNKYYCLANGEKYYLVYSNGWKALLPDGFKISVGSHYLKVVNKNGTFELTDASESEATIFRLNDNSYTPGTATSSYIKAILGGETYYLSYSGEVLKLSTTAVSWNWNISSGGQITVTMTGLTPTQLNTSYAICYVNDAWKLMATSGVYIQSGSHYLTVIDGEIADTTDQNSAILWATSAVLGNTSEAKQPYICTFVGENIRYLYFDDVNNLVLRDTKAVWNRDSSFFYKYVDKCQNVEDRPYLCFYQGKWQVCAASYSGSVEQTALSVEIANRDQTHFLSVKGGALADTSAAEASRWLIRTVENAGGNQAVYIYTYLGTTQKYLSISSSNELALVTTETTWYKTVMNRNGVNYDCYYYGTGYYLNFNEDSGVWELVTLEDSFKIYYNASGTAHYLTTYGSGVSETTNAATASRWIYNSQGTLKTTYGASTYYLTFEEAVYKHTETVGDNTIVSGTKRLRPTVTTTETKIWSYDSVNHRYFTTLEGVTYYLCFDTSLGGWVLEEAGGFHILCANQYLTVNLPATVGDGGVTYDVPTLTQTTDSAAAYVWHVKNGANGKQNLFVMIGQTPYYLYHEDTSAYATAISISTSQAGAFTLSASGATDTSPHTISYQKDGITFRLSYLNASDKWMMIPENGFSSISYTNSGTTTYMAVSFSDSASSPSAVSLSGASAVGGKQYQHVHFHVTQIGSTATYTITVTVNNQTYYLSAGNPDSLSKIRNVELSTSEVRWTKVGNQYYHEFGTGTDNKCYLGYDGSKWVASPTYVNVAFRYILSNGNYMILNSGKTGITSKTSLSGTVQTDASIRWFTETDGRLYAKDGNDKYYLTWSATSGFSVSKNSGGTAFTITANSSNTNESSLKITSAGLYVISDYSGWNVAEESGGKPITVGTNQYVNMTGTSTLSVESTQKTYWYQSGNLIYAYYNGVKYYWGCDGSSVTLTTNSSNAKSWTASSGKYYCTISGTYYYIVINSSTLKVTTSTDFYLYATKSSTNYYAYRNSSNFLKVSSSKGSSNAYKFRITSSGQLQTLDATSQYIYFDTGSATSNGTGAEVKSQTSQFSGAVWSYNSSTNRLEVSVTKSGTTTTYYVMFAVGSSQLKLKAFSSNRTYSDSNYVGTCSQEMIVPSTAVSVTFGSASAPAKYTLKSETYSSGMNPQDLTKTTVSHGYSFYGVGSTRSLSSNINLSISDTIPAPVPNGYQRAASALASYRAVRDSQTITKNLTVTKITTPMTYVMSDTVNANPTVIISPTTDTLYTFTTATYRRGTYIPIRLGRTDEDDSTSAYYDDCRASTRNTGYIVGGAYSSASGSGRGDIRVSRYSISNVRSSYSSSGKEFTTLYTFNDSGSSPVAITNTNSFTQLEYTKENFRKILEDSGSYVYGLHFMDAQVSTSHVIQAEATMILNKSYVNYELPESCIDFNVAEEGYIVLYAGDYYGGNSCFFSLYQVFRDANNDIENIYEIIEIYTTKTEKSSNQCYIYKLKDASGNYTYTDANGKYTGATTLDSHYNTTPVFKTKWLTNPSGGASFSKDYIYYFELPVNKGEYALGSVAGQDGGYLLYLDIATNGNRGTTYNQRAGISSDPLLTEMGILSTQDADYATINSLFNVGFSAPYGNDAENFSIKFNFDHTNTVYDPQYGEDTTQNACYVYTIEIVNQTGQPMELYVLLLDDDDDPDNEYLYRYRIKYNGTWYNDGSAYDPVTSTFYATASFNLPAYSQ